MVTEVICCSKTINTHMVITAGCCFCCSFFSLDFVSAVCSRLVKYNCESLIISTFLLYIRDETGGGQCVVHWSPLCGILLYFAWCMLNLKYLTLVNVASFFFMSSEGYCLSCWFFHILGLHIHQGQVSSVVLSL